MGNRGNIKILEQYREDGIDHDNIPAVCLYTHWGGFKLPLTLQTALKKEWRWTDGAYLARIIFAKWRRMIFTAKPDSAFPPGFAVTNIQSWK